MPACRSKSPWEGEGSPDQRWGDEPKDPSTSPSGGPGPRARLSQGIATAAAAGSSRPPWSRRLRVDRSDKGQTWVGTWGDPVRWRWGDVTWWWVAAAGRAPGASASISRRQSAFIHHPDDTHERAFAASTKHGSTNPLVWGRLRSS